jgi:hypothetical protein
VLKELRGLKVVKVFKVHRGPKVYREVMTI